MQYVHAERWAWLTWFLDPEHTDPGTLREALRFVPEQAWPVVIKELAAQLTAAVPRAAPEDAERTGEHAVGVPLPDIELKLALLWEETARRFRAPSVVLPSSQRPPRAS